MKISYNLQPETSQHLAKVPARTVADQSSRLGFAHGEPLLVILDAALRYAKAYRGRFDSDPIAQDGFAHEHMLTLLKSARALLNMDGAVAMEKDITTDSKDNAALEGIFWEAMSAAGFDESDL